MYIPEYNKYPLSPMNTKPSASLYNDTHQDNQNNTNKYFPLLAIGFALLGWFMALGTSKTQFVRFIDVALYGPYFYTTLRL